MLVSGILFPADLCIFNWPFSWVGDRVWLPSLASSLFCYLNPSDLEQVQHVSSITLEYIMKKNSLYSCCTKRWCPRKCWKSHAGSDGDFLLGLYNFCGYNSEEKLIFLSSAMDVCGRDIVNILKYHVTDIFPLCKKCEKDKTHCTQD